MFYHNLSARTQNMHHEYMSEAIRMYNSIFIRGFGKTFNFSYEIKREVEPLYRMGSSLPIDVIHGNKTMRFVFDEMRTEHTAFQRYRDDTEFCDKVLSYFFLLVEEQAKLLETKGFHSKLIYPPHISDMNITNKLNKKFLPHPISFYLEQTVPYRKYILPKLNTFISSHGPNLSL